VTAGRSWPWPRRGLGPLSGHGFWQLRLQSDNSKKRRWPQKRRWPAEAPRTRRSPACRRAEAPPGGRAEARPQAVESWLLALRPGRGRTSRSDWCE
jgi:hypothetical protein